MIVNCLKFFAIIIIGYIGVQIFIAVSKAIEKKNNEIDRLKRTFESQKNDLGSFENSLIGTILGFFKYVDSSTYTYISSESYENTSDRLDSLINSMRSTVSEMKRTNEALVKLSRKDDMSQLIAQTEKRVIPKAEHLTKGYKEFAKNVYTLPTCVMLDEHNYGKINRAYWNEIHTIQREEAVSYINKCDELLGSTQFDEIYKIDIAKVLQYIWFFAVEKTFSSPDFSKATRIFYSIYRYDHVDITIASFYAKQKIGGEEVLREAVRNFAKGNYTSERLTLIASALMWMNAYQSENVILQHMLSTGKEMSAKTQERLHSLSNGGGKAPSGFDVQSASDSVYFDVSALTWKDDEYIGLFENLAFQDKVLTYSLAIRDENKDLFIAQGIHVPETYEVLKKLEDVFSDEYGSSVTAEAVKCIALSGSGEEKMDGILVFSSECKQMEIIIHIARIGKKLIIKFYTLFMPEGSDLSVQKQQALSMYKNLSPSVAMWESSLKDTMLMAVEQLLNTNETTMDSKVDFAAQNQASNEPVF